MNTAGHSLWFLPNVGHQIQTHLLLYNQPTFTSSQHKHFDLQRDLLYPIHYSESVLFIVDCCLSFGERIKIESYGESLDSGSKCGSSGGTQGPGLLQMELHSEVYSPACQEQPQVLFSGQEALFFLFRHGF